MLYYITIYIYNIWLYMTSTTHEKKSALKEIKSPLHSGIAPFL